MSKTKASDSSCQPPQDEDPDVKHKEAIVGVLAQRGYRQVSLPIPLIERIEKFLGAHKDEGFTSIPEFIRQAIREKIKDAAD